MIPEVSTLANYSTSGDYRRLTTLARKVSVICIVDRIIGQQTVREVARTFVTERRGEECLEIWDRGEAYVTAFDEEEFMSLCSDTNVEFIEPLNAPELAKIGRQ